MGVLPHDLPKPVPAAAAHDCVIVGAGCAGLALATALHERAPWLSLAVVEPRRREDYVRDRTWCYWDAVPHRFEHLVEHRWSRWSVRHGGHEIVCGGGRHVYCELSAQRFHLECIDALNDVPNVDLRLGTRVRDIVPCAGGVLVRTDGGTLSGGRAFDGRTPPQAPAPALVQHFVGLEVRVTARTFRPDTVTLMDFDIAKPSKDAIGFVYVLPYDERHALVEATFMSPTPYPEDVYLATIDDYLGRLRAGSWRTLRTERGRIPMDDAQPPAPPAGVTRIGTAAGLVRPSSGYGFLAMQRWSDALADGVAEGREPPRRFSRTASLLDHVFLSRLRHRPAEAAALFRALFEGTGPDRLARFLSDAAGPRDYLAVAAALPLMPFAVETMRCLQPRRALRGGRGERS